MYDVAIEINPKVSAEYGSFPDALRLKPDCPASPQYQTLNSEGVRNAGTNAQTWCSTWQLEESAMRHFQTLTASQLGLDPM